ncbi:MAG: glycosyltransferase family 87 protein [Pseudomonadota bacterium]
MLTSSALIRLLGFLAPVALPLVVVLVAVRYGSVIVGMAPQYAFIDTIYFYSAAVAFLEGVNPYTPGYEALGVERYGWRPPSFGAFYYPPTLLPLIAPLGLMEPPAAGFAVMATNAGLIIGALALSLWRLHEDSPYLDWRIAGAAAIFVAALICYPPLETIVYGHIKPIFLAAFALWFVGVSRGSTLLQAVGLTIMLLKPQLGIPLAGLAFLWAPWRGAAIAAGVATGVLYIIAAWQFGLFSFAFEFLANTARYTSDLSYNSAGRLIGVSMFLEAVGLPTGPFVTLTLCGVGVLVLRWIGPKDAFASGLAALAIGLLAAPTHLTDVVVLLPALVLVPTAGPVLPRLMIAVGLLGAGGIDWVTRGMLNDDAVSLGRAVFGTVCVTTVLAGLLLVMKERRPNRFQATRSRGASPAK